MLKSFDKYPFPRETDLAAIIELGTNSKIRSLLRKQGVVLVASVAEYPALLSRFSFHESWYASTIDDARTSSVGVTIAALQIPHCTGDQVLSTMKVRRDENTPYTSSKFKPRVVKVGTEKTPHGTPVHVEYTKVRPLRTEFFRRERHEFVLYVDEAADGAAELLSIVDNASDGAVARDIFEGVRKDLRVNANPPGLEGLSASSRTAVFQRIFDMREEGTWRPRDVRSLKVRRYSSDGKVEDRAIEGEERHKLTSAVFRGHRIDTDDHVKSLVEKGYFFRSAELAVFRPTADGPGRDVIVKINFSEKPKVLLVSARPAPVADGEEEASETISMEDLVGASDYFWRQIQQSLALEHAALKKVAKPVGEVGESVAETSAAS